MEFDGAKKIEVEVSENVVAENEVRPLSRRQRRGTDGKRRLFGSIDPLDVALVPVILGIFVSLGFLFAGIFKASAVESAAQVSNILAALMG